MRSKILWNVTLGTIKDWREDKCLRLAASLAYYTAFFPTLPLLLSAGGVGLVLGREQVAGQLAAQLESLMGPSGRELVNSVLMTTSPEGGTLATILGLVILVIGATVIFGELQTTMNLIWELQPARTNGVWARIWAWLKERVFSLAIVFALAFLLLVSLVISAALTGTAGFFWGPAQTLLSRLLELAVSLVVLTLGFALLFKYVPDAEIRCRHVWLSGLVTVVLFTVGKTAIGAYLGHARVGSAYGAAGSMVVLLVWVYYSALIVFFGAEFTQAWATQHGGVAPQPHAVSGAAPQTKGEAAGRRCVALAGDVGDERFCQQAVRDTVRELGRLDILVNNAAEQHPQEGLEKITSEQLERTFRTNVFSYFYMTKAALSHLRDGSAVINTTSVTASRGSAHLLDYAATKGAIVAFIRSLAKALVARGIRVNGVALGPIWTPLIPSTFPAERVAAFGVDVPMQRVGQPEEVAPSYIFLASDDASYMTGQVLHPNGGEVVNG